MKRVKWILLAVVLVIVVIAVGVGIFVYQRLNEDVIELEPMDGDLAFVSDRDGSWDIFVVDPDGNLRNVTAQGEGDDYLFNFTFSSEMIYFYTNRSDEFTPARVKPEGGEVQVMNWFEAGAKTLADGHLDVDPNWAPDAQRIAWVKTRGLTNDICLASVADVNDFDCLTEKSGANNMLAWSPDGSRIVFVSDRTSKHSVFVVDVESGEQTQLSHDEGWDFQPVWSLDGAQILYLSNREDDSLVKGEFDMYVVAPDGTGEVQSFDGGTFKGDPTYSPSGTQVAYMSNEDGAWHIYVMDADGSNIRRITEGESNNLYPVWVPKPAEEG